uniref:Uncharacterized protein n=1 Tax=Rhizophora mucronata TaxID=61149 RepID=A0A2P2NS33_RHIMU
MLIRFSYLISSSCSICCVHLFMHACVDSLCVTYFLSKGGVLLWLILTFSWSTSPFDVMDNW